MNDLIVIGNKVTIHFSTHVRKKTMTQLVGTLPERLAAMASVLSALAAEVREAGSDFHADCVVRAAKDCSCTARAVSQPNE